MRRQISNLKEITQPILEDMKLFQHELDEALHSEIRLINIVGRYIMRHRGKHIRPILTILTARLCGKPSLNSYRAAALIEILHIASLVHDDVVDEARKRRGFPSVNHIWKNRISVLMGDFLFSKALINMIGLKDFEVLELISSTAEQMASGEMLQIEKSATRSFNENSYFDMIYRKTATLIATSCELGALTTTKKDADRQAMGQYGTKLGMAFQIKDDLFDFLGLEATTGKDKGADLRKNLITLPLIHSYGVMSKPERKEVDRLLRQKKKSSETVDTIADIIRNAGGFEYAYQKIDEYSHLALEAIDPYPDSPYKKALTDLVLFNTQRSR
ncbi:MAG: polyprenyl synthetase family protein [Candidatus Neomarinimicrobiota bacterium]